MDIPVEQQNFESIVKPKVGRGIGGVVSQRPLVLFGAPESSNQPNLKGKREKSSKEKKFESSGNSDGKSITTQSER